MEQNDLFRINLINWYLANRRQLPWRETKDPYLIWISEVMLQQTRVNQGLEYYKRFTARFPDVNTLAAAPERDVLKMWEGLGYYSRARHLLETARIISKHNGGQFPEDAKELLKLKGIGKYTAAAIASIAFNQKIAVVDGNVIRFISRFKGITDPVDDSASLKKISGIVNNLIDEDDPGTFNQALMEFGALQCIPVNPDCRVCPFTDNCIALKQKIVDQIPIKSKKTKVIQRFFNYLVIEKTKHNTLCYVLKRRAQNDIWRNLYDFPLIESVKQLDAKEIRKHPYFLQLLGTGNRGIESYAKTYRHVLTHRVIHTRFFKIHMQEADQVNLPESYFCTANIRQYPLPRLISRFVNECLPTQH